MAFSEWQDVDSSNIEATRFDEESGRLEILYRSGFTYYWDGVTADQHENIGAASSPGAHVRAFIEGVFGKGTRV